MELFLCMENNIHLNSLLRNVICALISVIAIVVAVKIRAAIENIYNFSFRL